MLTKSRFVISRVPYINKAPPKNHDHKSVVPKLGIMVPWGSRLGKCMGSKSRLSSEKTKNFSEGL